MLSKIKNIIKPVLMVMLITSPSLAFADTDAQRIAAIDAVSVPESPMITPELQEDILAPLPKFASMDEALEPLQNRMILSLFGREATIAALGDRLTDPLKEKILSLSSEDLAHYVDPFPSGAIIVVSLIFRVLYIIAFSFWLYMFSSYVFNRLFSKHAEDLEGANIRMGVVITSLRSFIVMALCVPIFSDKLYSQVHMVGFKMIGRALDYAQRIDDKFSVQQKVGGSRYFVPKPAWVEANNSYFSQNITTFSNCVVRAGGNTSSLVFGKVTLGTQDNCKNKGDQGGCNKKLNMTVTANDNTCSIQIGQVIPDGDIANAIKYTKGALDVNLKNYDNVAVNAFSDSVHTIINSAVTVASAAMRTTADIKYSSDITSDRVFNSGGWFRKCDLKTNKEVLDQISNSKTLGDIKAALVKEQFCQSAYLVKKYGYPDENYAQDAESDQMSRSINLCTGAEISTIDGCAEKLCSSISSKGVTKLFSCANASVNAGAYYKTSVLHKLGFIVSPALAASDVRGINVPASIQSLLTSWWANSEQQDGSFIDMKNDKKSRELREKADQIFNINFDYSKSANTLSGYLRENAVNMSSTTGDTFGYNRFYGCITGGGEYINNGVPVACSSSLSEIHRFGLHLMKAWAAMQFGGMTRGLASHQLDKVNKRKVKEGSDGDNGSLSKNESQKEVAAQMGDQKGGFRKRLTDLGSSLKTILPIGVAGAAIDVLVDHKAIGQLWAGGVEAQQPYGKLDGGVESAWWDSITAYSLGFIMGGASKKGGLDVGASTFSFIKWGFLGAGVLLGIIIPIVPIFLFYFALVAAFANFTAAMIAMNFHIIYALAGVGNDILHKLKKLISKWLLILLRIPMLVVGFWMSMYILDGCLPVVLKTSTMAKGLVSTSADFAGIFSFVVMIIVWCVMFFITVFTILDSVTGTYLTIKSLVFEDDSSEFSGNTSSADKVSRIKNEVVGRIGK